MTAQSFFTSARNQAFIVAGVLILLMVGLIQFFLLGEEIEEQRSRAAKLSIAEIIARQQNQNTFENVRFTNPDINQPFSRAAQVGADSLNSTQTSVPLTGSAGITDVELLIMEELRNATRNLDLRGIIKNDLQSVALLSINGSESLQTLEMGASLGNNIVITEIRPDAVIFSKGNVQLALQMNGVFNSQ